MGAMNRVYANRIPITTFWALSAFVAMVYSYLWDVCMDWSVVRFKPKFGFLRPMLAYEPKGVRDSSSQIIIKSLNIIIVIFLVVDGTILTFFSCIILPS